MTVQTVAKPGKGKPQTEAEKAAVALMEMRVCELRMQNKSFGEIESELGITNADRVYRRAVMVRPIETREEAFRMEIAELASLREQAIPLTTTTPDKGIPVRLGIHDRVTKLHGLDHSARIADANLALDAAKVQMWGSALVTVLAEQGLDPEAQRAAVVRWGELLALEPPSE